MIVIFVGDQPSSCTDPYIPFKGARCEKRLREWIIFILSLNVKFRNYLVFNKDFLTECNPVWAEIIVSSNQFVALGNEASKALTKQDIPHFKLPHPSGRNRQINDKQFIEQKLKKCKEWLK